ncbi:MAG TPA: molybdopterin cofactor-binding domain-containing protein [Xanthobacteraceae bacterium]|jgi:CO/xanthine dehydrogenase Mo-binding subunit|nr:molybdopterin cofactor-binding domain-containing protein [Xanthobacteraceae bacterium]
MTLPSALPNALPSVLADNPRLDRWLNFAAAGKVELATGRVELGQGVLTAMTQIAAEELDVAFERIIIRSGDTDRTPNEGYTAGSQSMQAGGIALRAACAESRTLFLEEAARRLGCAAAELVVRDGRILRNGAATQFDYWSLAASVNLAREATGTAARKPVADYTIVGRNAARVDLPAKLFGKATFVHDMAIEGMSHARVVRQPNRGATLGAIDEAAIRRAARGPISFLRDGNFLAIVGDDETAVEAAATAAAAHATWRGVEQSSGLQQEANWLLQRPSINRTIGAPPSDSRRGLQSYEAVYTRGHLAHASIAPSCALALYRDGHLTVWTHCQGVYPLRAALSRMLKLEASAISVRHVQGPGCYGHNGADDAAADAAVIAVRLPGRPIRVRWRRQEEFAFEPVSPAMVVKVRATLDTAGHPVDWTTEIWSGTHQGRPGGGAMLLAAEALPDPPPVPAPIDVPEAAGGGATRNGEPLYDFAAKRIIHHLVPEVPRRTSALRSLGAMPNVFALESFIDELAERAQQDPIAYRLARLSDPRARRVIERAAAMANWNETERRADRDQAHRAKGVGFAQYKNRAAYAAVIVELEVEESIRLLHAWCAADAGLVVNPDAVINQLEGGIIQSASWVLKEQVRFDTASGGPIDWETYPVLRFSEVPEIAIDLVASDSDTPLGVGEATAGPTAAAIGNAASRALGIRMRDLPLTRERIMARLLA